MKTYNIGAVARLTGISVHNLRVWEKRHHAVATVRTQGGRRVYDEAAVARLVLLKGCVDNGASIRHIAALPDDELRKTLGALTANVALAPKVPQARLGLVGSYAQQCLSAEDLQDLGVTQVERYTGISQWRAGAGGFPLHVLVVDEAALSEEACEAILQLAQQCGAVQVHVIYRFARQRDVLRLRARGVHLWNAPVDREAFLASLAEGLREQASSRKALSVDKVPPRRFSDEQLAALARIASRVECECPRHLSELVIALCAFESYSNQCENRNVEDAALHLAIYRTTGKAREIMEEMLATVLKQEGIEVEDLPE